MNKALGSIQLYKKENLRQKKRKLYLGLVFSWYQTFSNFNPHERVAIMRVMIFKTVVF